MGLPETVIRYCEIVPPTVSLFKPRREAEKPEIARASRECAKKEPKPVYSSEIYLLSDISNIMAEKEGLLSLAPVTYWSNKPYHPADIYAATVEFFDCHNGPLPTTALPPADDIKEFIGFVLGSNGKLTVAQQFGKLLDISGGNILGAANVGMFGSRILARGWDSRAYPDIVISPQDICRAANRFAPFDGGVDPLGDNYYYWTTFFATVVYNQLQGVLPNAIGKFFCIGTPIMRLVRQFIVGQPTLSSGSEASNLGRLMGMVISRYSDDLISQAKEEHSLTACYGF